MINLSDDYLMMIEPEFPVTGPVLDELTEFAVVLLSETTIGTRWRGFHGCECGEMSGSCDLLLPDGRITNSLLIHYVRDHRSEVPQSELDKLIFLLKNNKC